MLVTTGLFAQDDSLSKTDIILPLVTYVQAPPSFMQLDAGAPIYVLSEVQLKRLGIQDIGGAMKYIPSVQLKDYGGVGGIKTISYRSLGANHTGVVLDNVSQINTQVGAINLSSFESFGMHSLVFSTSQPHSIFASASAYLPANSINIYSQLLRFDTTFSMKAYQNLSTVNAFESGLLFKSNLGENGFVGAQLHSKYGSGAYNYIYNLTGDDNSFKRINSSIVNYKARLAGGYAWDAGKITASIYYNKNEQELPGAVILYNPSNDQTLENQDARIDLNFQQLFTQASVRANAFIQSNYTKYFDPTFLNSQGFLSSAYRQNTQGVGVILSNYLKSHQNKLFYGSDAIFSQLGSNEFAVNPSRFNLNSVLGTTLKLNNLGIESNIVHQLILDQARMSDTLMAKTYSKLSPFVGLTFKPFRKTDFLLRTSFKQTFRMPTFNDLYYNFIGNSNLKPEEASLLNFGLTFGKYKFNDQKTGENTSSLEISVDGFYNLVKNKIVAIPTKDLFNWSMQNIGKSRAVGSDVVLSFIQIKNNWKFIFTNSHTLNFAVDITDETGASYGHQLPYTPVYSGSLSSSVSYKGYGLTNNLSFCGQRFSLNENIQMNKLSPYLDWNIGVDKNFKLKHYMDFGVSFKVMNILNKNYEIIRSFPMPGRYYQLTLNYSFK